MSLAPVYSSALANLTSGLSTGALTSFVPSASVDPLISSYVEQLTSALPTSAQPTGAAPTALPSTYSNGTADPTTVGPHKGMSLKQVMDWIAYLLSTTFKEGKKESKRAHPRALAAH